MRRPSLAPRGALATLAAAVVVSVLSVGAPGPAAAGSEPAATASSVPGALQTEAEPEAAVVLTGVTPQVAGPQDDVAVTLTVENRTATAARPTVQLRAGGPLGTRSDVARHAARPGDHPVVEEVDGPLLAPGGSATVQLIVPADRLDLDGPYGVLPLTLTVVGMGGVAPVGTFLPYHVVKEYEPLRLAVALPLTADADPTLLTGDTAARGEAWARMAGPGSRADRIVRVAEATDATVVADPSLLGLQAPVTEATAPGAVAETAEEDTVDPTGDAAPTTAPPTAPEPTADPPPEQVEADEATRALGRRVAALEGGAWFLPPGDPDLSALAAGDPGPPLDVLPLTPATFPEGTDPVPPVAWPAGSTSNTVRAYTGSASPISPEAVLLPETRSDPDVAVTTDAVRADDDGRRVLAVDDRLSALVTTATADTGTTPGAAALAQQALADSITLLAESPGRDRSTLLLPGRDLDPDPDTLVRVVNALDAAPWITRVDANTFLDAEPAPQPIVDPDVPADAPSSPLSSSNADDVASLAAAAAGLRPAVPGDPLLSAPVSDVLVSTRWRGHVSTWTAATAELRAHVEAVSEGIYVLPSTINFFAEHGALQVTVVNDLDHEVRDVRLTTDTQGRPPRLVVRSEPQPLTVRPHSRTTVRFDVEAIAAGVVPITTSLRTADGTALGQDATVRVRVQPTSGWLLLGAGGVVGAVFLFGLFRAVRAGKRRVADEELRDVTLD